MIREKMWEEFESQLKREVRTPITMSYDDSIRIAEMGIKDVVKRWKKRLEQEPCENAIKRDELLKAIDTWDKFGCDANNKLVPYQDFYVPYIHYDDVVKCIKGMPSVNPQEQYYKELAESYEKTINKLTKAIAEQEPKTGRWIYDNFNWRCSECNETPKTMGYVGTAYFMKEHFKFCNHCGAKMEGVK